MKTLLLMRHAKSSWKHPDLDDHDRPLNKRGKRDAPRMGRLIATQELVPDLIASSTAQRAQQTAVAVAEQLTTPINIIREGQLYLASPDDILDVVAANDESIETLLVIGHNPGMEILAEALGDSAGTFPTGALAVFSLHTDTWNCVRESPCTFESHWTPRTLDDDLCSEAS